MKNKIINWTFIGLLALLTACGGSSTTSEEEEAAAQEELEDTLGEEAEDAIVDTASDVVTTLADVNGFKIVTEIINPHSYDYNGTEVNITAFVKDHSNNPVDDGTVVSFVADDNGLIEDQCITTGGTCTVIWTSSRDRNQPTSPAAAGDPGYAGDYRVTIMGRTIGEDSFIDKNSNSLWDTNETRMTQSEAFIDTDDDGTYDAGVNDFDEYFDFNGDGTFNEAAESTKFRGKSCSAAAISAGHCATRLEVWDTVALINSDGGAVEVSLYATGDCSGAALAAGSTLNLTTNNTYCIELQDQWGNVPPIDTKISVDADNGTVKIEPPAAIPNYYNAIGRGFINALVIIPDADSSNGTLTIEIESVRGVVTYKTFGLAD